MDNNKKIRVLVVDDSLVFREILTMGICSDPCLEVVATAGDPYDARDRILEFRPDVMTCDVEMPKMNGIEFIRRLLPQYPLPVVVVSMVSQAVFDAMDAGAVDFVTKPDVRSARNVELFLQELIAKIKIAAASKVTCSNKDVGTEGVVRRPETDPKQRIIAIGASTGGTEALSNILKQMPPDSPGIVVVQHIPPVFSRMFAERLNHSIPLQVKEAETGDIVIPGHVFIAPGDRHMKIRKVAGKYRIECFEGEKVNGHCPSVDILFDSVAREAGEKAIGVILTGMGYDGARGLLGMKRKGARTIGQDEKSSVVYGMPRVAFEIGAVEKQTGLADIAGCIFRML